MKYEAPALTPLGNLRGIVRHAPACFPPVESELLADVINAHGPELVARRILGRWSGRARRDTPVMPVRVRRP